MDLDIISHLQMHTLNSPGYFFRTKLETHNAVIQFITLAEKQTNSDLKIIQPDGDVEFKPLKDYFQKRRILHRTWPHIFEQNDTVERKHRNIVETSLTLLAHDSLPMKFRPDAFATSAYHINRLPTKVLKHKIPAEVLLM